MYLYNSPEYLQTSFAAVKVGLVPSTPTTATATTS